ncbi:MAG: helix-turn-helix transcriptional regulator [Candidatus Bathyarchaeota archaeon]|nr:helix-turn-helix transcriptional regulator [Candidatus Termiticorpusculum sp.]
MKTRMKEYREKTGITQEQLAQKLGVARQTILFLEKGKYNPSLRLAYQISKELNAKIEDIFTFDDENNKEP